MRILVRWFALQELLRLRLRPGVVLLAQTWTRRVMEQSAVPEVRLAHTLFVTAANGENRWGLHGGDFSRPHSLRRSELGVLE